MKLIISMPGSRFTTDLPDEVCADHYRAFVDTLLDAMAGEPDTYDSVNDTPEPVPQSDSAPEMHLEPMSDSNDEPKSKFRFDHPGEPTIQAPKGFLHMKCPHCGNIWGFHSKYERERIICKECGQKFGFDEPLAKLFARCECGATFSYHTNRTEALLELNCLECGAPMQVEYNEKMDEYQPIREG